MPLFLYVPFVSMLTWMDESTKEEWDHIGQEHAPHIFDMPKRIIAMLKELENFTGGFAVDQLHHALQTATMARRAGADDEMVLISLIHDIGKVISVMNHGQIAAGGAPLWAVTMLNKAPSTSNRTALYEMLVLTLFILMVV